VSIALSKIQILMHLIGGLVPCEIASGGSLYFYWLLDTCKTNAYLIWKAKNESPSYWDHTRFFDTLVDELLAIPLESELPSVNPLRPVHTLEYLESLLTVHGALKTEGIVYKGP
jgi:hypothetical protein